MSWITTLLFLMSAPAFAEPTPEQVAAVEQVQIPSLVSRATAAKARIEARRGFVGGKVAFGEAFPDVSTSSLGDSRVLKGRLGLLDDAAVARVLEANHTADDLPARSLVRLRASQKAAWDAETTADDLERKMLTAVLASLSMHPELTTAATGPQRMALQAAVDSARALVDAATDPNDVADAERALARADGAIRHHDQVMMGLRLMPAGGQPPDLSAVLEGAEGASDYTGAGSVLRMARPFLTGARAAEIDQVLAGVAARELTAASTDRQQAWVEWEAPLVVPESREQAQAGLADAEARLDGWMQRAQALPATRFAGDADRTAAMANRLQALELRRQVAETALAAFEAIPEAEQVLVQVASQSEVDAAKERATQAKENAADARERRVAELLSFYASAQGRGVDLAPKAAAGVEVLSVAKDEWVTSLNSIRDTTADIAQRSALDDRSTDADEQHDDVRELLATLRQSPVVLGTASREAEADAADHAAAILLDRDRIGQGRELLSSLKPEARTELEATLVRWEKALDDEERLVTGHVSNVREARDLGLRTLKDARMARRALEPYISRAQQVKDRGNFLGDLQQQVALLPSGVWMMVQDRWVTLRELPSQVGDYNVLRALFSNSIWTFAVIVAWWWGRSQVSTLAVSAAQRVRKWRPELRISDVAALKDPTMRFMRNAIDLALGYSLIWSLAGSLGEITFLLSVYLQLSLFRVVLAAFDLLVIRSEEVRPALAVLRADMHALARMTVRRFSAFWILSGFVEYLLWDVLALDTISSLMEWLLGWAFWGLVAWALWRWQPYLRERLERFGNAHPAVAWLARDDGNPLFRVPRALGSVFFFLAQGSVDLLYKGARDGSSLSWLLNLVSKYRLEDDPSEVVRVWSAEERLAFVHADTKDKSMLERADSQAQIASALSEWKRTFKRGLVAIVGDRGAGKHSACESIRVTMESSGLKVTSMTLDHRITEEPELLAWLAAQAGVAEPFSADDLIHKLEELEPRGMVIRGVHWSFERRVGGMTAISALLYVLNATSDRHFWALSVHGPAWDWFDSLGSLVDTGVFRLVTRLPPLTSAQLRALTIARAATMGLTIDFSGLVRTSAFGADPEIELERATAVFYRLLGEASSGNPTIAMHMFARCVQLTDDEHVVKVRMASVLSAGVIESLSDAALFVLVALRLQDVLSLSEVVEVTNLSLSSVRTTVRDLVSRGLIERVADDHLRVPDDSLQAVTRTLRRRHFLHLGAS